MNYRQMAKPPGVGVGGAENFQAEKTLWAAEACIGRPPGVNLTN